MLHRGWTDAFRALNGNVEAYSWWNAQTGNGFRLDHVLLSPGSPLPESCTYETRQDGEVVCGLGKELLSDHAAMLTSVPTAPSQREIEAPAAV
jgi:exonuclease III